MEENGIIIHACLFLRELKLLNEIEALNTEYCS